MKHTAEQSGSALLIIILVLSAVAAWCLAMLKSVSLNMDMALKRQEHEQIYRITEGVMRYGMWLCKTRFAQLTAHAAEQPEYDFDIGSWKLEGGASYSGRLQCTVNGEMVDLVARVYDAKKNNVGTIKCQLVRQVDDKVEKKQEVFVVRQWKELGERNEQKPL